MEVCLAAAREFSVEFRITVAKRIISGESVSALSDELKIKRSVLYRWRDLYRKYGPVGLDRPKGRPPGSKTKVAAKATTKRSATEQRMAELEQRLGRMALENDFLRRAFKRVKAARSKNNASGGTRCTEN